MISYRSGQIQSSEFKVQRCCEIVFDRSRIVCVFEGEYALGQGFGGVVG